MRKLLLEVPVMMQATATIRRLQVEARIVKCPRCGGWIGVEQGMGRDLYLSCVNCGWEREVNPEVLVAGPRTSY